MLSELPFIIICCAGYSKLINLDGFIVVAGQRALLSVRQLQPTCSASIFVIIRLSTFVSGLDPRDKEKKPRLLLCHPTSQQNRCELLNSALVVFLNQFIVNDRFDTLYTTTIYTFVYT